MTEISLIPLILRSRRAFAGFVTASLIIALLMIAFTAPRYRAEAVIAPVAGTSQFGDLGGLSGVAGLIGIDLNASEGVPLFSMFRYLLHAPELARTLDDTSELLKEIFHRQWDAKENAWRKPGLVGSGIQFGKELLGGAEWRPPDFRDLAEHMERRLLISEVGMTGLVRLSFEHEKPEVAREILATFMSGADQLLRLQEKGRKTEERTYLVTQLSNALIMEVRVALARLIASTEQDLVLLSTTQPVAYIQVQPVVLVPEPVYPPRILFILLGISFGVISGIAYVLLTAAQKDQ